MSVSTITECEAKQILTMPQKNGVTRLIQLEPGDFVVTAVSKEFVDSSAVMDRGFGRICARECASCASRGVSSPACLRDRCGVAMDFVGLHKNLTFSYGRKFTVTVLEQFWVPASHTLYLKLAWPVVPVESSYCPSFGVVAITTPSR